MHWFRWVELTVPMGGTKSSNEWKQKERAILDGTPLISKSSILNDYFT